MENKEFSDNFLNTEGGMFQMEITNVIGEAKDLVEASMVDDEIKNKCTAILSVLVDNAGKERNKVDPYDLSRNAISNLLDSLDQKDEEQRGLFESVKDVIWKACYSVKGWKWPPQRA